jgi:hypothetical protein
MTTNSPNNSADPNNVEDALLSIGARVAARIKDAVDRAATSISKAAAEQAGKNLTSALSQVNNLSKEIAGNAEKIKRGLLGSEEISKQIKALEQSQLDLENARTAARLKGISVYRDTTLRGIEEVNNTLKQQLENELSIVQQVEKKVALTSKFADVLGAIPGLSKIVDAERLQRDIRAAVIETDNLGNVIGVSTKKFAAAGTAIRSIGTQMRESFLSTTAIVGLLVKKFLEIDEASVELNRLTGQTGLEMGDFNLGAATTAEILKTQAELTKQTGMNVQSIFSKDVIIGAANLQAELGLAADEAGSLAMMAQTSGTSVEDLRDNIVGTTSAFNASNRSAISQGVILRDVAKTSNAIKLSLGQNPKAITEAATQARRLGMDLNQVDKIAESLLNFESSIENELEAQLLTGNQINMSKAREMALTGKTAELGEELFKNSVDIHRFGEMTRLGQEAQAKALGMTRDELAKVAYQRALESNMTEEAAAAAADVNAEDMKRLTIQNNIASAMDKITQAFAPLIEGLAWILGKPVLGQLIIGAAILIPLIATLVGGMTAYSTAQAVAAIATATQTTATLLQAGANTTLAGTQTVLATTGAASAGVFARMGTALGAFGTGATAAIGPLLAIAATAAGIGIAFYGLAEALKTLPEIFNTITLEKASAVAVLATSFASLAAGLAAVAFAGTSAMPVLLAAGALAAGIGMIATAGGGTTTATEGTQGIPQTMGMEPVVNEIKQMRQEMGELLKKLVAKDTSIYLDSNKIENAQGISRVRAN